MATNITEYAKAIPINHMYIVASFCVRTLHKPSA